MSKCNQPNCGCNSPGQQYICYTTEPLAPCIGVNLTVNNTEDPNGYSDVNMVLEETNQISAYKEHLEFVNSPEPLSGLKKHVVLRLTTKFLNSIANIFKGRNVGTGAQIYKGSTTVGVDTFQDFRTIKSSSSVDIVQQGDEIIASVNEQWLDDNTTEPDYPVIESEDVGDGTSMRRDLVGKKIGVRTLKSDSFVITTEGDGSVKINSAGGGSSSNDWYLDANYSRPLNWIPDETIDGIPLPKGTLNDPFLTFDEYLKKVIGATAGANSRVNPRFPYKTLKIISYTVTDKELEVNTSTIELVGVDLIYTGTENYAADTGRLFDAMPKTGGVLNEKIYFGITGEGNIINRYHFGAIRHKTSESATITSKGCFLEIIAKGKGLNIFEHEDSTTYTLMTRGDGTTPFLHGGLQVYGSTQAPTVPLVKIEGKNTGYWSASFIGTKLNIVSKTQSNLELDNASLVVSADSINYLIDCNYIGFEKKLYTGLAGMTADEDELIATTGGLFFKPYEERSIFKSKNTSELRIERIGTISDSRLEIAVNSIFHIENSSSIDIIEKYYDTGGGSSVNLIKYVGTGNTINLSNSVPTCHMHYFVKGDSVNSLSLILKLSQMNNVDIIKKNTPTLVINTLGTYSSIKTIPINTGLQNIADNATALAPPYNYIPGMEYYNTTIGAVSRVY